LIKKGVKYFIKYLPNFVKNLTMNKIVLFLLLTLIGQQTFAQSDGYKEKKAKQLAGKSPFQDEIDGKFPDHILYQDADVIAIKDNAPQLPVHVLIIPKKRIPTLNDLMEEDSKIVAKMIVVAKNLAQDLGIAETGYRLAFNTNEHSGQSVFHIHLHLLGGYKTGAMVDQTWRNRGTKPSTAYLKDIENVKLAFGQYYTAWLQNNEDSVMTTLTKDAVIMPDGLSPKKGMDDIRNFWFPKDGSKTTITRFDYVIDDYRVDMNSAFIRSSSVLSFTYELNGQKTIKNDLKQVHTTFLERQMDGSWKISCKMWSRVE
jgi:histidine triad (HIT) family protein